MGVYETAIIKSLCYSQVFAFPLTDSELWQFLIWEKVTKPSLSQFKKAVEKLILEGVISRKEKYYFLGKRSILSKKRREEELLYIAHGQMAQRTAKILSVIPTVEMIGLSGKLALGVAEADDDIDLFIVSASNTVFFTRLMVWVTLNIAGVNRVNRRYERKRVCSNMFCDLKALALPQGERDIYSAHEVGQLKVLYDRGGVYAHFRDANRWTRHLLPNLPMPERVLMIRPFYVRGLAFLGSLVEPLFYWLQKLYMQRKITTEIVEKKYVRFHPQDARLQVIPQYKKLVDRFL